MKPNNKIKLKNTTLSPVLSNGRDGGVCWNKGPALSSRLSQGWVFFCPSPRRRSLTSSDERKSPWPHPEEQCHCERGWHEPERNKAGNKRSIFPPTAFHEQWVTQANQSCWIEWQWEEDSIVLDKDISIMKAPWLQDWCRTFPLRQPIEHSALWSPLILLNWDFKKQISSRGWHLQPSFQQILFGSGHQVGSHKLWGVWTLGCVLNIKTKSQVKKKPPVPSDPLGSSHSYREGAWKPVVAYFVPHQHGSYRN